MPEKSFRPPLLKKLGSVQQSLEDDVENEPPAKKRRTDISDARTGQVEAHTLSQPIRAPLFSQSFKAPVRTSQVTAVNAAKPPERGETEFYYNVLW